MALSATRRPCRAVAASLRRGRALSTKVVNSFDQWGTHPGQGPYGFPRTKAEQTPYDTTTGTVSTSHWDGEWSSEQIHEASQDHCMFTWGPSDPARAGAPVIKYGEGVYVYDEHGKQYMDWTSQAVCTNLGYTVPEHIRKAVADQMEKLPFVYSGLAMTEPRARLSKLLAELLPGDLNGFIFPSSGGEANEGAIRMARRFTGRQKIFTRYRSYHGGTSSTLTATGDFRRWFAEAGQAGFVKMSDPNPFGYSWGTTEEEASERALASLHEQVLMEGPHTIAAVLLEHIPGAAGVLLPPKGYIEGVQAICKEYDILLIADEVMTGFGRTGKMFGFQHYDVSPDIVTFAKGISAAWLPISGIACTSEIQDFFRTNPLGYGATYQAHPVPVTCAYEVVKYTIEQDIVGKVQALEPILIEEMQKLIDAHDCVRHVRVKGLFAAADLVETCGPNKGNRISPLQGGGPSGHKIAAFKQAMLDEGLIALFRNCIMHVAPPLIITEEELRDGFRRLNRALTALA